MKKMHFKFNNLEIKYFPFSKINERVTKYWLFFQQYFICFFFYHSKCRIFIWIAELWKNIFNKESSAHIVFSFFSKVSIFFMKLNLGFQIKDFIFALQVIFSTFRRKSEMIFSGIWMKYIILNQRLMIAATMPPLRLKQ